MIEFEVLGPLRVVRNGMAVPGLNALLIRRLLAALLSRAGTLVRVVELARVLWGDDPPPSSRKTLQVYIRRLRSALGDDLISHEADGYRIEVRDHHLDSLTFAELLVDARHEQSKEHAARLLEQAVNLWRGHAFEDVREHPPLAEEAHRLDEERLLAESRFAELQIELGRHQDAIPRLTELIDKHPFREDFRGHLMLALYRSGRQAEALELYAGTRNLLDEELGVEPGPSLKRLHKAILRAELELDSPRSLESATPRQLPAPNAGFVGRLEQIQVLDSFLTATSSIVIATIAGMAGVGKTALAVHWAHSVADRFPDGQIYLNLNGFSLAEPMRPLEALSWILRSIGVRPENVPLEVAEGAAMLRTLMSDRRMFLLLDNARSADQVRPLLPASVGSLVLVTSRNRLSGLVAHEGAQRLDLDVLSPDEATDVISKLIGRNRVHAEHVSVTELIRLCAYLPLALRLAAAILIDEPRRTISSLVDALAEGNRLNFLTLKDEDQSAIRAAFGVFAVERAGRAHAGGRASVYPM